MTDLLIVGGGLAGGLIALRLAEARPELSVTVVEAAPTLGGEHTWSFFESDVPAPVLAGLRPLIAHRWDGYDVRFPRLRRTLATPYASVTAERFHAVVSGRLGKAVRLNAPMAEVGAGRVTLASGETLPAHGVIDARGPAPSRHLALGWQKFLGLEVETAAPHGLTRPIVMDATVEQIDGYRFLYVLPFGPTRLLIEDTRYADGPELDRTRLRADACAYAAAQGWSITEVVREEHGVLPVALAGDIGAFWDEAEAACPAARVGLRAALFHPTTGYSLPDAARLAERIARLPDLSTAALRAEVRAASTQAWARRGFFRLLNRMLFRAGRPDRRYAVLQRFYGLPEPLIRRFYADLTALDRARLLAGKPPVPVGEALRCLDEARLLAGDAGRAK